jgi:hypothetical protein
LSVILSIIFIFFTLQGTVCPTHFIVLEPNVDDSSEGEDIQSVSEVKEKINIFFLLTVKNIIAFTRTVF